MSAPQTADWWAARKAAHWVDYLAVRMVDLMADTTAATKVPRWVECWAVPRAEMSGCTRAAKSVAGTAVPLERQLVAHSVGHWAANLAEKRAGLMVVSTVGSKADSLALRTAVTMVGPRAVNSE